MEGSPAYRLRSTKCFDSGADTPAPGVGSSRISGNQQLSELASMYMAMARCCISRLALPSAYVILLILAPVVVGGQLAKVPDSQLALSVNPSSVVIKVGDNATVTLTLTTNEILREACFGEQGFPDSGFVLAFIPQCVVTREGPSTAELVVEATPAAAPQNFTALILAGIGNQTASAPLTVTVVPAIPPWIPWMGILLFFLVIGAALFVKPRKAKGKGKKSD